MWMVENKLVPDCLAVPKILSFVWKSRRFGAKAFPLNIAHLTYQPWVQILTSLTMTRIGPRIEPITFPMQTDALRVTPQTRQLAGLLQNDKF